MKPFRELTHFGQGRRLQPLVHDVLRRFGIVGATLGQFRETINMVYRVRSASGERYVLRMTPPWHFHGREDIHSEISWMSAIARDGNIDLPTPIPDGEGETVITASRPEKTPRRGALIETGLSTSLGSP